MSTFQEIATQFTIDGSYEKGLVAYEKNEKKNPAYINFKIQARPFTFTITGPLSTNGISVNEYKKTKNYSVGIEVSDDDQDAIREIVKTTSIAAGLPDTYRFTSPLNDEGKIYFKLKLSQDKISFLGVTTSDRIKLNVKKPDSIGIDRGTPVTVTGEMAMYINYEVDQNENLNAGVYFKVTSIE